MYRVRLAHAAAAVLLLCLSCLGQTPEKPRSARIVQSALPLQFEPVPGSSMMVGRSSGATVAFRTSAFDLYFPGGNSPALTVKLPGARPLAPAGTEILPSQTNYLIGSDPSRFLPAALKRRRPYGASGLVMLVVATVGNMSACGGSSGSPGTGATTSKVAPETYTFQLLASDGTNKQTQSLTLIVQ